MISLKFRLIKGINTVYKGLQFSTISLVNEISLIFYGELKDVGEHLLYILKVLTVKPENSDYSGFYINEKKFGFESHRKISLDLKKAAQDYLIYRYLTPEELEIVNSSKTSANYHILLHKYLSIEYVKNNIQLDSAQISVMVDYSKSLNIQNYHYAKKYWPSQSITKINIQNSNIERDTKKSGGFQLPVLVLFIMKVLFNPVNELKHYALLLRYSNLRMLSRFIELFIFLDFIFKAVVVKFAKIAVQQAYYKFHFILGLLRVLIIKCGFGIRHILLMCGFKSFGFFVDSFNFFVRLKNAVVNLFIYTLWHFIFYQVGHYIFYRVGYFIFYRVGYYIFYNVRHAVYMTAFKTYGLVVDVSLASYKFFKLVLLYPLRKAYWFTSFQYNKRIKKYFKNDAGS